MAKDRANSGGSIGKSGYAPLNVGYSAKEERGNSPKALNGSLPKAPKGGTGENGRPSSSANTGTAKK